MLAEATSGQRGLADIGAVDPDSGYQVEASGLLPRAGRQTRNREPPFAISELPELSVDRSRPRTGGQRRHAPQSASCRSRFSRTKRCSGRRCASDALIVSGGEDQVVATPFTYRFPGIADGDLLPADNVPLFLGAVKDFLDIAIWLNRDDSKGKDLAELFEQKLKSVETKEALTVVGGLVLAAPEVAVAAGAWSPCQPSCGSGPNWSTPRWGRRSASIARASCRSSSSASAAIRRAASGGRKASSSPSRWSTPAEPYVATSTRWWADARGPSRRSPGGLGSRHSSILTYPLSPYRASISVRSLYIVVDGPS